LIASVVINEAFTVPQTTNLECYDDSE